MEVAAGVKTVGELEMLYYLKKIGDGDKSLLVIDSRKVDTVAAGSIPGAVNIPASRLDSTITSLPELREIMQMQFAAVYRSGYWDFSRARTLVLFCNGPWCSQSSVSIKNLLKLGYPTDKLIWYRGGMQSWEALGLTTVKSEIAGMGWGD
jgi:rhodanese-related sulfurtransferase